MFVAHSAHVRTKALELRTSRGLTIDEIASRLALPRSTSYGWVGHHRIRRRPVRLTPQGKGAAAVKRKHRRLREAAYLQGVEEFLVLLERDVTFRDFICFYLAEGYKRDRNVVSIANSDPAVVLLATRWLRRLTTARITFWLQYHADQDIDDLRRFWADVLDLADPADIRVQRKSNSGGLKGRTWRSRHGVLTVRACDTMLRARMQAWLDLLRDSWT